MALEHLAVMDTDLGVGALVHRACLETSGASEIETEIESDALDIEIGGCALCGESLRE
jgi:hypothetical protein